MIFEAERGSGWAADIALDEIRFQPGDCGGHVVVTTSLPPPTTQPTTTAATQSKFSNYTDSMRCCTNEIAARFTSYQRRYWRHEKDAEIHDVVSVRGKRNLGWDELPFRILTPNLWSKILIALVKHTVDEANSAGKVLKLFLGESILSSFIWFLFSFLQEN